MVLGGDKPCKNQRIKINSTVEVYFYPPEQTSDEEAESLNDSDWEQQNRTSIDSSIQ